MEILAKRYKIDRLIKEGGMGALYLALDRVSGRQVAVKRLAGTFENEEERRNAIANFITEMGVMKRLRHPQIPQILDHFVEPSGFFFVLDYIEGDNLTQLLEKNGRQGFSEEWVVQIGIRVCQALAYLHRQNILHRDIKPSNLVYRQEEQTVMLVDFGISRASLPKAGFVMGTPGYMAPEGPAKPSIQSDIFSLGATLHELAAGIRPEDYIFEPPHKLRRELSETFSSVVMKALAHRAGDRYANAEAFEEALQALRPERLAAVRFSDFDAACDQYYRNYLHPLLLKIRHQYPNECQTHDLPEYLNHLVFTLGNEVPHALIIEAHPDKKELTFSYQEGLLSPKLLGSFSPFQPADESRKWIDAYMRHYLKGN